MATRALGELNSEQRRAVEHGHGPLMVLAGAGSGKTRVLVQRAAHLVGTGIPPGEILAVTFTNKAAGEVKERLRKLLGYGASDMWIGTFHATCARILRMNHDAAGLGRNFTIFDEDDQNRLMTRLVKEEGLKDEVTPRSILWAIDRAKNAGADPIERASPYLRRHLEALLPKYSAAMAAEDAVDFNDLLLKVLDLMRHPEVGDDVASRFSAVLVDEFQDTNWVQYQLVSQWVRNTGNITVVGDDDQCIYSWRGAEPRNLLDFGRDYPEAGVVKLEQNYRSTSVILQAANAVIAHNEDRHDKKLWTDRDGGEAILWEETADDREEGRFIAAAIAGMVQEEGREWGDIAVLYRTHSQSRVLEEQLRARGIDYRIVGGVSFFQRMEIKDLRAYLRLLVNPSADSCFERVVNVPARGIGKTTLASVRQLARTHGVSLLTASRRVARGDGDLRPSARKKLAAFVAMIDGLCDVVRAQASVAEVAIQVVERSGYRERLEAEDSAETRDRLANLSEFVGMASDYDDETDGAGSLAEFDERVSLASSNDAEDGRGSAVTLMTTHAAKGLEFPVVFVCGLEDGLFPSLREDDERDDRRTLEEERRLAYVAFTRAMERLILTCARVRRRWGQIKLSHPSRFIHEIPEECLVVRQAPATPTPRPRSGFLRPGLADFDDFDQRDAHDDGAPSYDVNEFPAAVAAGSGPHGLAPNLQPGAVVEHATFGLGRVLQSRGSGADTKLLIDFSSVGVKTVLARFVDPA